MQLQFLAPVELFFKQLNGYSFRPVQFLPLCGLSRLHFYQEWSVQPLWKVKRLEQYTSVFQTAFFS